MNGFMIMQVCLLTIHLFQTALKIWGEKRQFQLQTVSLFLTCSGAFDHITPSSSAWDTEVDSSCQLKVNLFACSGAFGFSLKQRIEFLFTGLETAAWCKYHSVDSRCKFTTLVPMSLLCYHRNVDIDIFSLSSRRASGWTVRTDSW